MIAAIPATLTLFKLSIVVKVSPPPYGSLLRPCLSISASGKGGVWHTKVAFRVSEFNLTFYPFNTHVQYSDVSSKQLPDTEDLCGSPDTSVGYSTGTDCRSNLVESHVLPGRGLCKDLHVGGFSRTGVFHRRLASPHCSPPPRICFISFRTWAWIFAMTLQTQVG